MHRFLVFTTLVRSTSMQPGLQPGDLALTTRVHRATRIRRGDRVVLTSRARGRVLVKRVIGMPGERVEFDGTGIRIDGRPFDDAHAVRPGAYRGVFDVPDDGYLVLGDYREASDDSRSWTDPYVRRRDIRGIIRYVMRARLAMASRRAD